MRSQQVKNSFQSGVLSPRLSLRSDSQKYAAALEQCVNFLVNPQGGIVYREGFQNIVPASVIGSPNRILQFHNGGNTSDMLVEVNGDGLIRYWIDGVLQTTTAHNYTQGQLEHLYFTNQEVMAVILHPDHPPYYIDIDLSGDITGDYLPSNLVPIADYRDEHSPTATLQGDATYNLDFVNGTETTWNPSRKWILRYDNVYATGNAGNPKEYEFSSTSATLAGRVAKALALIPALKGDDTTVSVTPGAAGTDFTLIDVVIAGAQGGKLLELFPANSSADRHVDVNASVDELDVLEPAWSYPAYVLEGGVYYQCILPHTPIDPANKPPNATYWTPLPGKPEPFDWQYPDGNAWSASAVQYSPQNRGFPTVGVVHQQRLILMANPGFTMGVFGSRINQYRDFVRGPQDDDPFFFAIDTSDTPTIKWAESQQNLILGTSGGDYNLTAEVTLSPSDIRALKQNNARSNASKAVTINTDIFYIEQGKEKLRATGYIRDVQSQSSNDVSQIAEHLLNVRAKRIALMQTPEVVVFILREDGSLCAISYSHEQQMGAWYEFSSQGVVTDIAVQYTVSTDEDELWATITYDGGITHYIEKMPYPKRVFAAATEPGDPFLVDQDLVCMDGWIRGSMTVGDNNIITGLGQFEGLLVACMVEDAWAGEYTVKEGNILLDAPDIDEKYSGTYAVGFRYIGVVKTFEMSGGNPKGSGLGTRRKWNKLYVKMIDSALPIINGTLPPDRHPETLMDMAEIIQPGLTEVHVRNVGWNDGAVTIVQNRPYPTEIIGCYGEFSLGNA